MTYQVLLTSVVCASALRADNLGPFVLQLLGRAATWADWARNPGQARPALGDKIWDASPAHKRGRRHGQGGLWVRGAYSNRLYSHWDRWLFGTSSCADCAWCSAMPTCRLYLLTDMGSIIDMVGLTMFHTTLGVTQQMYRRSTGHVEVCLAEYGRGFSMPDAASFGRSQVWSNHPLPKPIRITNALDMRVPLEALLLAAFAIGGVDSGSWPLCYDSRRPVRTPRSTAAQPRLELDEVRSLRSDRADSQAHPRQDDRVEHCLGVPGTQLRHATGQEGRKASQEED